jgi:hypothetical protein
MPIIPLVLALLIGGQATAGQATAGQTAGVQAPITLKFQPPVGKTFKYHMTMAMKMDPGAAAPPMEMTTDSDIDMKVLSRANEISTIESRTSNAKITTPPDSPMANMAEQMEKTMSAMVVESQFDSHYNVKGIKGAPAGMESMSAGINMSFPTDPIKIGDKWSSSLDMGKMLGAMTQGVEVSGKIPIKFTLEKVDQKGDQSLASIQILMDGDMTMSPAGQTMTVHMHGTGHFTVDLATGMTVESEVKSNSTFSIAGQEMTQRMTQSMKPRN